MTKSSDDSGKQTVEIPAVTPDAAPAAADALEAAPQTDVDSGALADDPVDPVAADFGDDNAGDARDVDVTARDETFEDETPVAAEAEDAEEPAEAFLREEPESGPDAEMSGPALAPRIQPALGAPEDGGDDDRDDLDATIQRPRVEPPAERPRHNTLASITRPRGGTNPQGTPLPPPPPPAPPADPADPADTIAEDDIPDETEGAGDDEAEWAIADQPTVALSPGAVLGARPQFLDTGEQSSWPPRHPSELPIPGSLPEAAASLRRRAIPRPDRTGQRRLASPNGRPMPDALPRGVPRAAIPDARMERLQELHRRRDAAEQGDYDPNADRPVTDRVRQWWGDLRPGLKRALDYQHEARASGVHPIPAYEQAPSSRLGDVFGRLTASARELTGRAQSAAAPALRRLHDQAEHAAQAIVGRFEGDPARQQAPFLGPGRIAVFFRSGVSVGQAQRLLSSNEARPLRIIPRKHGFLAYVLPGTEEQVSNRLRVHPYIRDVIFMPVDAYGDSARGDEEY